jgi:hypothetical protein
MVHRKRFSACFTNKCWNMSHNGIESRLSRFISGLPRNTHIHVSEDEESVAGVPTRLGTLSLLTCRKLWTVKGFFFAERIRSAHMLYG